MSVPLCRSATNTTLGFEREFIPIEARPVNQNWPFQEKTFGFRDLDKTETPKVRENRTIGASRA